MKIQLALPLFLLCLCACAIKVPDDGMALGDEANVNDVNTALSTAQTGVPQEKAYHVGDEGVIKTIDYVFTSSGVKKTEILSVTAMDDTGISVKDHIVETNEDFFGKIKRVKSSPPPPAQTTSFFEGKIFEGNLFGRMAESLYKKVKNFISKISFEQSSAVADSEILSNELSTRSTVQANSGESSSRFFGLKSSAHTMVTKNCNHLKECKVSATHIEFNQVVTTADGKTSQVHWVYEISTDVPGLFTVMSKCGSTVITQNGSQIPFKECEALDTFHFGG